MNKVCLIGRLTADPELRTLSNGELKQTRFNLAVGRNFKNSDGEYEADFVSCVAWRQTAEMICKHFEKGSQIGIEGKIQTGSYDKEDGSRAYTTDIIVEHITFIGSKKDGRPEPEYTGPTDSSEEPNEDPFKDFGNEVVLRDEDLPF